MIKFKYLVWCAEVHFLDRIQTAVFQLTRLSLGNYYFVVFIRTSELN